MASQKQKYRCQNWEALEVCEVDRRPLVLMESVISDLPRSVKLGTILTALTPQLRLLQLYIMCGEPAQKNKKSTVLAKISPIAAKIECGKGC